MPLTQEEIRFKKSQRQREQRKVRKIRGVNHRGGQCVGIRKDGSKCNANLDNTWLDAFQFILNVPGLILSFTNVSTMRPLISYTCRETACCVSAVISNCMVVTGLNGFG